MTGATESNRRILLRERPVDTITNECFEIVAQPVPIPAQGQALVRVEYVSIDPVQRSWLSVNTDVPVAIGEVVRSTGVGTVVSSNNPALPVGARVFGMTGWQDYTVIDEGPFTRVLPDGDDAVDAMSIFGPPGLAAYFGLFDIGRPKHGDTLVVSAAAGGVGSVVVQLGKIAGCRVVGLAGSDEKCRWVEDLGAAACINYRTSDVGERLDHHCPNGIDVYFDNVGGAILEACVARIALRARIVLCGMISRFTEPEVATPSFLNVLRMRARVEGFTMSDYLPRASEAVERMRRWIAAGELVGRAEIADGLLAAPDALAALFAGTNTGKLIVKL
jgi:NADPH-dependent curcumin reductase